MRTVLVCIGMMISAVALHAAPDAAARQGDLKLSFRGANLETVIAAFTEQTGVSFSYEKSLGRTIMPDLNVTLSNSSLDDMLAAVFVETDITYKVKGKVVALTYEPKANPAPTDRRTPMPDGTVIGQVFDEQGNLLPGVSIVVKGTSIGTSTDYEGNYSIKVSEGAIIVFMYIGFDTQEIAVGARSVIDVRMQQTYQTLDDVIVVGYGAVKRRDLVGAVDQVDSKLFENRSSPSVSRSLQGAIPNLNISMRDGKPSRDATINIRGTESIGAGGSALILIDGVEGDMGTVNPQDIASISVLKDASSAAIYGARGAFGVILVTTKSAEEGEIKVNYSGSVSVNTRTIKPQVVTDGYQWTQGYIDSWNGYYNGSRELNTTINNIVPYTDQWFQELARRSTDYSLERVRVNSNNKYEYFGNTDWHSAFYKDYNISHEHNLSVSGGGKNSNFYISGRYYDQDGIYKVGNERYRQYNLRAKGGITVRPWLRLSNNTDFTMVDYHQPMLYYDTQIPQRMIEHSGQPVTLITNPDGTWTYAAVLNGYAGFSEGTTYQQDDKLTFKNKIDLEIDIIKDVLKVSGDLSFLYSRNTRERVTNMYTGYTGPTSTTTVNLSQGSTLEKIRYDRNYVTSNVYSEYSPRLGDKHSLKLLAGWNLERQKYNTETIKRTGIMDPEKPSWSLMDGTTNDPSQGGYEWSYVGLFFRANYNFKGKYLAEISGRYDGSSKFPSNSIWGFFPSGSLGWRLSEEGFMDGTHGWLDNLKIRFSLGSMGNGNVSPYKYTPYLAMKTSSVVIGDGLNTYTYAPDAIPLSLTWETSTTGDIGIDLDLLKNRLSVVFDYYQRYTTDMYTVGVSLPAVYGSDAPKGNNASLKTKGWEISVGWRDEFKVGGKLFGYHVKAMLWDARSWVTKYINPTGKIGGYYDSNSNYIYNYYEGMEIGEIWGYRVEGLFRDQDEIDSHAVQSFLQSSDKVSRPGEVKFADLNEDGKIDRGAETLEDHGDLSIIGNAASRFNFGVNLGVNWNGIGISTFWQGVGKKNWYPRYDSGYFWGQYNRPFGYMLTAHTGDNVYREELDNWDTAYWPRYAAYQTHEDSDNRVLGQANDRYMQNAAYIRLKNLTVDYTFPAHICRKLHIKGLKVYFSGENLWTWSPIFKYTDNYDPEVINAGDSDFRISVGDGYSYPMLKTFTLGVNLTF